MSDTRIAELDELMDDLTQLEQQAYNAMYAAYDLKSVPPCAVLTGQDRTEIGSAIRLFGDITRRAKKAYAEAEREYDAIREAE